MPKTVEKNKENRHFPASCQYFAVTVPRHTKQFCQRIKGKAEVAVIGLRPASRILVEADQPIGKDTRRLAKGVLSIPVALTQHVEHGTIVSPHLLDELAAGRCTRRTTEHDTSPSFH